MTLAVVPPASSPRNEEEPLSEYTRFARFLRFVWVPHKNGFYIIPKIGQASLMAFVAIFLLLVVAFGLFLEILSYFYSPVLPHKFGMYLVFVFTAPVLATLGTFFFRRLLRGLWGEIDFITKTGELTLTRKGRRYRIPRTTFAGTEVRPAQFPSGEIQYQVILRLKESEKGATPLFFAGLSSDQQARDLAGKIQAGIQNPSPSKNN